MLREAARWLVSEEVTHVAMEATGIYSMPVYHALIEQVAAAIAAKYRGRRPRPVAVQVRDRLGGWLAGEDFAAAPVQAADLPQEILGPP